MAKNNNSKKNLKDKDMQIYDFNEAVKKVKDACKCKFDSTIELHIKLGIDVSKQDQNVRTTVVLPAGTGKEKKVAVFASSKASNADLNLTEEDLVKIENGTLKPKVDFDVIIAEPKFMPKLAKLGKILGPSGMMPNPKSGTVTTDVEKAVEQSKKGKIELRNEQSAPVIHTVLGKRSFENANLEENFKSIISSLKQNRPQKVKPDTYLIDAYICSTMSPAYRVAIQ